MGRRINEVPADITDLLRGGGGIFVLADAAAAGIDAKRINRLCHAGLLTAVVRGCYVATARLQRLNAWELHREQARAFALATGLPAYVTGWAAVMFWRLRTAGPPPRLPTLLVPREPGRGNGSITPNGKTVLAAFPDEHRYTMPAEPRSGEWSVRGGRPLISHAWLRCLTR